MNLLPFASGDKHESTPKVSLLDQTFDPFIILDNIYNNDLDVNQFYLRMRNINIKKSEYIYLDNFPQLKDRDTFSILLLNIRSMTTNFSYFVDTILTTHAYYNILGFTETRLDADIAQLYTLPGYNMFTNNRNRYGGGVAIYIFDNLKSTQVNDYCLMDSYIESLGIEFKSMSKTCLCLCIYRPPQGNTNDFINAINNILSSAYNKKYYNIFLFGDFNIDLMQRNNVVQEFINTMSTYSLFPLTTRPTRATSTSATLIDHIWSTQIEQNIGNYIINTDITDHFPVLSQFKHQHNPHNNTLHIMKRTITQTSLEQFYSYILNYDWSHVIDNVCPNTSYNNFFNVFKEYYDVCFPEKKIRINSKSDRSPHITPAILKSIKEKNRLERLAKKWPLTYKEQYKIYRNRLTSLLKTTKKLYYQDQLLNNQGKPSSHWKSINTILGRCLKGHSQTIELVPCSSDIPNKFNEHFLNAGGNMQDASSNEHKNYLSNSPDISLYLTPVTQVEVKKCILNLKTTSPGYDDISPKVLKHTADLISTPLMYIINLTFKTGIFPDKLKVAKVIPLFKSGCRQEINNYRPISLLSAFSKIFEKIITSRLVNFLEHNKVLTEFQHGFRSSHSTETAILQFVNNVYKYLERKSYLIGVFIDLSKAFDSLNHKILLDKLEHYGIRGVPLQLFRSYISNRSQIVFCNSSYSDCKIIHKGVPQGSILGPILFTIYVNDIINCSRTLHFTIYADDTNLLLADNNLNTLHYNINLELESVRIWIISNKLKLNTSKTKYMIFQNRSIHHNMPPVTMDGVLLERVTHIKFLGILIDEHINWNCHINSVVTKLSRMGGILYRVRDYLTQDALFSIYYTLCYPHLLYCVSIWGSTWPSYLDKVTAAQKKLFRTFFSLGKYDTTNIIFSTSNFLTFTNIYKYFLLLFIYKCIKVYQGINIFRLLNFNQNTRGNNLNLFCPQFRTTLFRNSLLCSGPHLWNSLPTEIKELVNNGHVFLFKRTIKKYLLSLQHGIAPINH